MCACIQRQCNVQTSTALSVVVVAVEAVVTAAVVDVAAVASS